MKQLIILACYIPVGSQSEVKARTRLAELRGLFNKTFPQSLQDETDTIIRTIVLAGTTGQESKIECIYPALPSPDVLAKLEEIMLKQNELKI